MAQLLNHKRKVEAVLTHMSIIPICDSHGHVTHVLEAQNDISNLEISSRAKRVAKHKAFQAGFTLIFAPIL